MDKNKLTKWWDTVEKETGSKKFVTMNVASVVAALTVWVILYNAIPDAPIVKTISEAEVKTKSTKTKKENV